MAKHVCGLDLGTYEIKIYTQKKDEIWKTKNTVAIKDETHVIAVGDEAYQMYEKAPDTISVVFPMQDGVIAHFSHMQHMLQSILNLERQIFGGGEYLIAVPTNVTEVEKRAFYELLVQITAKAKSVKIVEKGIADAVGMNIDVKNEKGVFIVDFGGGSTELSVLSSGGMVFNKLLKTGGSHLDTSIVNLVRREHDLLIGRQTAELLRKEFGVSNQPEKADIKVAGRHLVTGIPHQEMISRELVQSAMKEPLLQCINSITAMLERTPPDVRRGIEEKGIYMSGGMAHLKGLSTYLEESTGLQVTVLREPELCVAKGLKKMLLNKEYRTFMYSMLDEDYRWLR